MSTSAVNLILIANGNYVVAEEQAQLDRTVDMIELAKKEASKWGEKIPGLKEFDLSQSGPMQDSTSENPVGADGVVSLDVGGTTLEGLQSLEATFTNGLSQVGDLSDPLARSVRVSEKEMEISVTADYIDPQNADGTGWDNLYTAQENNATVVFTLNFGELTFSGDLRPGDWTLDSQERGDEVQTDFTLMHDGAITRDSGALDTGQEVILSEWFNEANITAEIGRIPDGQDPTTNTDFADGSQYWEGETIVETITLSADRAEELTFEFDLAGDGPLNRKVFSAV